MGLNLSSNPVWDLVLGSLAWVSVVYIFIYWPLAYWFLGRPFDIKFEVKNYIFEKDMLWVGPGLRLVSYTMGILLQPYRFKKINNKLFKRIVKGRFDYQDRLYSEVIDFRKEATKVQIVISFMMWVGAALLFIAMFLTIFHNFVLYPEIGRAGLT